MSSTNFNMRIDTEFKNELSQVLANYGLTIPQAFKLFGNQIIKTKKVPLTFDWDSEEDEDKDKELVALVKKRLAEPHKFKTTTLDELFA